MLDITEREIRPGQWLLYRVSTDHGPTGNWIIRQVESVDEAQQTIHLVGPNRNPGSDGLPELPSFIEYRTVACPRRLLLILDTGQDRLYARERVDLPLVDLDAR
jgi:hypothetical protein